MGKRELLLILVFVVAGVIVYELAAPPARGGGFSLGDFARRAVRELRSERAKGEHRATATWAVPDATQEIRVRGVERVTVLGEARQDLESELTVTSSGVDEHEAQKLAAGSTLQVDTTPDAITLGVNYPHEGRQRASMVLKVPSRLRVRLEEISGEIRASDIAGVYLAATRAETSLTNIAGPVEGEHRRGDVEIAGARSVQLRTRSATLRLQRISGATVLDLTSGELRAGSIDGPLEIDARSADIEADSVSGTVRVNASGGSVTLGGLRQAVRCEGQRTDLRLTLAQAAQVTAFTTNATLELVAPKAGGFSIDAAATGGEIRASGVDLAMRTEGSTKRASATVAGGGPTLSLRTTDGDIIVRGAGES